MLWFVPIPTARWRCITSRNSTRVNTFRKASDTPVQNGPRASRSGLALLGLGGLLELADLALEVRRGPRTPCRRTRSAGRRRGRAPAAVRAPPSRPGRSGPRRRSTAAPPRPRRPARRRWRGRAGPWPSARSRPGASPRGTARLRRPRLRMSSGTSSTRSYVVNRRPHARHSRRRRMAIASSARRESTTLSSFARQ